MSAKILSAALIGLEAEVIEVEADIGQGELGTVAMVGLPDKAVSEAKERVRSAIKNSGISLSRARLTINLAPADLRKHGPSYDLPIALSILLTKEYFECLKNLDSSLFVGELALNGDLRPVNGILSIAIMASKKGISDLYVPMENSQEAKLVKNINVWPIISLKQLIKHLSGKIVLELSKESNIDLGQVETSNDMMYIKGQEHVKRAMEIAAAGAHNMLMSGPPGSGKTLIAGTMSSILPKLSMEEALEITKIYSVAGILPRKSALIKIRPFRAPHHTASGVALVGGGTWPKPGEISLAHRGVLFLDEFAEFPRQVLEYLRQPLEDGIINISRAAGNLSFPAKFILVAAMNPCPCGFSGDPQKNCLCSALQVANYRKKISGPILDRIDLHVGVPRVDFEKLSSSEDSESSVSIRKKVQQARDIQRERFKKSKYITNSEMNSETIKKHCFVNQESKELLGLAVKELHLSARAYFRILKLARTIADLDQKDDIQTGHIAEALQYRSQN